MLLILPLRKKNIYNLDVLCRTHCLTSILHLLWWQEQTIRHGSSSLLRWACRSSYSSASSKLTWPWHFSLDLGLKKVVCPSLRYITKVHSLPTHISNCIFFAEVFKQHQNDTARLVQDIDWHIYKYLDPHNHPVINSAGWVRQWTREINRANSSSESRQHTKGRYCIIKLKSVKSTV
jgi:hypothetical protein